MNRYYRLFGLANLICALSISIPAAAGDKVGGGGDEYVQNFVVASYFAYDWLVAHGNELTPPVSASAFLREMEDAVRQDRIQSTNNPLSWNGAPKDAVYTDDNHLTQIDRARWNLYSLDESKVQIVAHEIFRRMGLSDDTYELSHRVGKSNRSTVDASWVAVSKVHPLVKTRISESACKLLINGGRHSWDPTTRTDRDAINSYRWNSRSQNDRKADWPEYARALKKLQMLIKGLTPTEAELIRYTVTNPSAEPRPIDRVLAVATRRICDANSNHSWWFGTYVTYDPCNIDFDGSGAGITRHSEKDDPIYHGARDASPYYGATGNPFAAVYGSFEPRAPDAAPAHPMPLDIRLPLTGDPQTDLAAAYKAIQKLYWDYVGTPPAYPQIYADEMDFLIRSQGVPSECFSNQIGGGI